MSGRIVKTCALSLFLPSISYLNSWTGPLDDFVAHSSTVRCLRTSPRASTSSTSSGAPLTFLTGGDDRLLKFWRFTKPIAHYATHHETVQPAAILSQHATSVEACAMDAAETYAIAGLANGHIKAWDLEHEKAIRTFASHKGGVTYLDFHPYGDFFVSASVDHAVKVWDIRKKTVLQSYLGHDAPVQYVRMSPDGRWVASGSVDGVIHLWDITAGKKLHTFDCHGQPFANLEYHPSDFLLLASTSSHLHVFDLDELTQLHALPTLPNSRALYFPAGAEQGISIHSDGASVVDFDEGTILDRQVLDHMTALDGGLCAVKETKGQRGILLAAEGHTVSFFTIDAQRFRPFGKPMPEDERENNLHHLARPAVQAGPLDYDLPRPRDAFPIQESVQPPQEAPKRAAPAVVKPQRRREEERPPSAAQSTDARSSRPSTASSRHTVVYPNAGETTLNIDMSLFLAKRVNAMKEPISTSLPEDASPPVLCEAIRSRHFSLCAILNSRLAQLQAARSVWSERHPKHAAETIIRSENKSALWDFLRVINLKPSLWNLDFAALLLPAVAENMVDDVFEDSLLAVCATFDLICQHFGDVLQANHQTSPHKGIGMDLSKEDRLYKAQKICSALETGLVRLLYLQQHAKLPSGKGRLKPTVQSTVESISDVLN